MEHIIPPATLRLSRDEARELTTFFDYLDGFINMQLYNAADNVDLTVSYRMFAVLFGQVKVQFQKRLLSKGNRLKIVLPYPLALVLYKLLKELPISPEFAYKVMLRQRVVDELHLQLLVPLRDHNYIIQSM